ncbi:hypothetical protein [Enemella evansiae]|uniref:hypothetical protein n=1 Tax=Enemella evansiae TaxID=2016499 RepID=UPI00113FD497|nr:hypothetical protein [Enemella evansiae]
MTAYVPILVPVVAAIAGLALSWLTAPTRSQDRLREQIRADQQILADLPTHSRVHAQLQESVIARIWRLQARDRHLIFGRDGLLATVAAFTGALVGAIVVNMVQQPASGASWPDALAAAMVGVLWGILALVAFGNYHRRVEYLRTTDAPKSEIEFALAQHKAFPYVGLLVGGLIPTILLSGILTFIPSKRSYITVVLIWLAAYAIFPVAIGLLYMIARGVGWMTRKNTPVDGGE